MRKLITFVVSKTDGNDSIEILSLHKLAHPPERIAYVAANGIEVKTPDGEGNDVTFINDDCFCLPRNPEKRSKFDRRDEFNTPEIKAKGVSAYIDALFEFFLKDPLFEVKKDCVLELIEGPVGHFEIVER